VLPHYEMGQVAAKSLIDSAGGLRPGRHQIKVKCSLIERQSVQQLPDVI